MFSAAVAGTAANGLLKSTVIIMVASTVSLWRMGRKTGGSLARAIKAMSRYIGKPWTVAKHLRFPGSNIYLDVFASCLARIPGNSQFRDAVKLHHAARRVVPVFGRRD